MEAHAVASHTRTVREACGSAFHEHLRVGLNDNDAQARCTDGPLPFDLELQRVNRWYRQAERDTFEPTIRPATACVNSARACKDAAAAHEKSAECSKPSSMTAKLMNARLGEILPVRDTHKVARLSSAYQPSARAGSIVDTMI